MKILKSMGIIVLVVTGVSLGLGSVSALGSSQGYDFEVTHVIIGISENGERKSTEYVRNQRMNVGDEVPSIPGFENFSTGHLKVAQSYVTSLKVKKEYHGDWKPASVELVFLTSEGEKISKRTVKNLLTLGGTVNLVVPEGYQLTDPNDKDRIVLQENETWNIQVKSVGSSGQSTSDASANENKPDSKPDLNQHQPNESKPMPLPNPSVKPHPNLPTPPTTLPEVPAKPQPAPSVPPVSTPKPSVIAPVHQSLTTNLPATTKPRPWAHHSALDLWEAAPTESTISAAPATHQATVTATKPAGKQHRQSKATSQVIKAGPQPATPKATVNKRLPQTNDRPNGLAIAIGSLLLSFTGIWRNRRIHQ